MTTSYSYVMVAKGVRRCLVVNRVRVRSYNSALATEQSLWVSVGSEWQRIHKY